LDAIKARVQTLRAADPSNSLPIPVDLVTTSGSGLDPHISPAAAAYQLPRVARLRHLDANVLRQLIAEHTQGRQFGMLGEPRVNVLTLNLALNAMRVTP
jgi:K+-transporting ATPase ATPase C chain